MVQMKRTLHKIIVIFLTFEEILMTLLEWEAAGGRLVDPPGRGSLWRYNVTNTPVNTEDDKLNCGGMERQWFINDGKCGICGDPWDGPRDHEQFGKYHTNITTQTYKENSVIHVTVTSLTNLLGWFEFRVYQLVPNKNDIEQYTSLYHVLQIGDTGKTKYRVWESGYHVVPLQLPRNFTCHRCLLQWKYNTGTLWGCDKENNTSFCCYGCGKVQTEYRGCADISIEVSSEPKIDPLMFNSHEPSAYKRWWCNVQCLGEECSTSFCRLASKHGRMRRSALNCEAIGVWKGQSGMQAWCKNNCQRGNCPTSHCICHAAASTSTVSSMTTASTTIHKVSTNRPGLLPGIVRVLQSRGCEYCRNKKDDNCKSYYCPGYNLTHVGFQGNLFDKVSKLSEYFCTTCSTQDVVCQKLFCNPDKLMIGYGIHAKCQYCKMTSNSSCLSNPECSGLSKEKATGVPEVSTLDSKKQQNCIASKRYANIAGMNDWCANNCNHAKSKNCFPNQCHCTVTQLPVVQKMTDSSRESCLALGPWRGQAPMNAWCTLNCALGYCPANMCKCGPARDKTTSHPRGTTEQSTSSSTSRTPSTTSTSPQVFSTSTSATHQDVDNYSINTMNGIMCNMCSADPQLYPECSSTFCHLYNKNFSHPPDPLDRVLNFSPQLFCGVPRKDKLFCKPDVMITPFIHSTICAACTQLSQSQSCDKYCQS